MPRQLLPVAILIAFAVSTVAQEPPAGKLPVVKFGDIPFYPQLPRIARIQGDVHLRLTTDGSAVISVMVESGQPMLAKAAQENVKTWKFEPHEPTSFPVIFSYHLEEELVTHKCDPDIPANGTIVLKLPQQVDITSHHRIPDCDDPNEGLDVSEPLRIFLTGCEIDGAKTPCDRMTISLHSGNLNVAPTRFRESEKRQGFIVPKEFRSLKAFDVSIDTGHGRLLFAGQDIHFLKGYWHLGIDHAPLKEETPVYGAARAENCVGFIVFEWGEPEVVAWSSCK